MEIIKKNNKTSKLIYFSGIGIDKQSDSKRSDAIFQSELYIQNNLLNSVVIRPGVILGGEDQFLNGLFPLFKFSFFIPLFGDGLTKFQPVYVKDVAKAVYVVINNNSHIGQTYNLGGAEIISFKEIIDFVLLKIRKKRIYIYLSFPLAKLIAIFFSIFPSAPITLDQVRLLEKDNIIPEEGKGFKELGIKPTSLYLQAGEYLNRYISRY